MTEAMHLPPEMVKRAREFTGEPVPARPAATVVLLRPDDREFELYVLRRASTMAFGGVYAFPGGGVDPSDRPETIRSDWAELLGIPDEQARAVVGAAARELFEEAGVLLAGPRSEPDRVVGDGTPGWAPSGLESDERVVGDVSADDWEADRVAVAARAMTMTELLDRRGLRLRDDLLFPWQRWITPEFEPRRYDTWFFVALLPQSQTARDVSGEADRAMWVRPEATPELTMLPPTRAMVRGIASHTGIADVVAAASRRSAATPVMPRISIAENGEALITIE